MRKMRWWVTKFGPAIARGFRHRQAKSGDIWRLDDVVLTIKGRRVWLWHRVDQNVLVLDEILQSRRGTKAEKHPFLRLMKKQDRTPKRFIIDSLRSYGATKHEILPGVEHRSHQGLNNLAVNGHRPF